MRTKDTKGEEILYEVCAGGGMTSLVLGASNCSEGRQKLL